MILPLLKLVRLYYSLPLSGGLVVIAAYAAGGQWEQLGIRLVYACISLFLVLCAGYALNDVWDAKTDAVNCPDRVIPSGQILPRQAFIAAVLFFLLGLSLSTLCGWRYAGVLTAVAAGLITYDRFSKRWGIFKDLFAAALATSLYPLALSLTEPVETARLKSLYIFPIWFFLTAVGYEMLKDVRDIKGDRLSKPGETPASNPRFFITAKILAASASILTLLPYLLGYCGNTYLLSSIAAIVLAVVSVKKTAVQAIGYIYAEVFLITAGSLGDLWVYNN